MLQIVKDQSTAALRRVPFYLVYDTDHVTPYTGLTFAAGTILLSKNGAAEGNHAGTMTEIGHGVYYYEATAGELDTQGFLSLAINKTGVSPACTVVQIVLATIDVNVTKITGATLSAKYGSNSNVFFQNGGADTTVIVDSVGSGSPPSAATIADAVWDEATSGHTTGGSTGKALTDASSAGDPWTTALPGSYTSGQAGNIIGNNLNASVNSRSTQTSVDLVATYVDGEVAAIKAQTDKLTFDASNNIIADARLISASSVAADSVEANIINLDASVSSRSTLTSAQVNTEVDTALQDINLDHLVKVSVDTSFATTVHLDSVIGQLADNGTSATFDRTTDSLEALQNGTYTGPSAVQIRQEMDANSTKLVNLDATVGSRATPAQVATEISDAFSVDTISELAQGQPSATPTRDNALMLLYMNERDETVQTENLKSIKNSAGTVICKSTVTETATTVTKSKYVSGP